MKEIEHIKNKIETPTKENEKEKSIIYLDIYTEKLTEKLNEKKKELNEKIKEAAKAKAKAEAAAEEEVKNKEEKVKNLKEEILGMEIGKLILEISSKMSEEQISDLSDEAKQLLEYLYEDCYRYIWEDKRWEECRKWPYEDPKVLEFQEQLKEVMQKKIRVGVRNPYVNKEILKMLQDDIINKIETTYQNVKKKESRPEKLFVLLDEVDKYTETGQVAFRGKRNFYEYLWKIWPLQKMKEIIKEILPEEILKTLEAKNKEGQTV